MYDALFVSNLCMRQNSIPLQGARKESLPGLRSGMSKFVWEGFDIGCFFPQIQGMKSMALWLNTF